MPPAASAPPATNAIVEMFAAWTARFRVSKAACVPHSSRLLHPASSESAF